MPDLVVPSSLVAGEPLPAARLDEIVTALEWLSNPPRCTVVRSTVQAVTSGTLTLLTFDVESIDTDGFHGSTNAGRLSAPYTGFYRLWCQAGWANNGSGQRQIMARLNSEGSASGGTELRKIIMPGVAATDHGPILSMPDVLLTAGDHVEFFVTQTSGASLDVTASTAVASIVWTGQP